MQILHARKQILYNQKTASKTPEQQETQSHCLRDLELRSNPAMAIKHTRTATQSVNRITESYKGCNY